MVEESSDIQLRLPEPETHITLQEGDILPEKVTPEQSNTMHVCESKS